MQLLSSDTIGLPTTSTATNLIKPNNEQTQLKDAVNSFASLLWEEVFNSAQRSINEINDESSKNNSTTYFTEMLNKEFISQMLSQEDYSGNSLSSEIYRQLSTNESMKS